jgi:hypothetical protein
MLGIASSAAIESSELKDMSPSNISVGDSNSWSSGSSYIANDVRPGAGERWVVLISNVCRFCICDRCNCCNSGSSECPRKNMGDRTRNAQGSRLLPDGFCLLQSVVGLSFNDALSFRWSSVGVCLHRRPAKPCSGCYVLYSAHLAPSRPIQHTLHLATS